uniref:Eukaryotic translation initiation factor 4E n=1 Tax=viral metagenome TaxID=1070528 RepID=A0A6C0D9R3_9ZZZZ
MDANTQLSNKWNLWYHHEKDNWKLSGYKKVYEISTVGDFWRLNNNWDKLKGINNKHYFLMKDDITPLWEDPSNVNGGCWSFKVHEDQAEKLWIDLSAFLVCNQIINNYEDVIGLSICLKKNSNSVIKIWNKDSKNNSLNLINKEIIKKWGTDIIYIAHMPEN